ncbi:hypothetical protein PB2503_01247 [Parvularcula bermudensis HTCC2503]|uniref:PilZ domain-containing protein n=1 Tax=Parvularcula bermudensis (strain ATCC BAA-594 / HTCC2503 / KCTC 12087) TaxID=314260 RepID=E0TBC5_PARBH|nr:PilZ domain-containing protein [Parvularcula bermudensis]ADM08329.1 hypothetical protein PB2503_01247 [Parvularcula bermudensis HTCC2503]
MTHAAPEDRRSHRRLPLRSAARFLLPEYGESQALVTNVSLSGLALKSPSRPRLGVPLIVYVDALGRLEAEVVRHLSDGFALVFKFTKEKTRRIARKILAFALNQRRGSGLASPTLARATSPIRYEDGREEACKLRDFSILGAIVESERRPFLGATVIVHGRLEATVVRHLNDGYAVEFSQYWQSIPKFAQRSLA